MSVLSLKSVFIQSKLRPQLTLGLAVPLSELNVTYCASFGKAVWKPWCGLARALGRVSEIGAGVRRDRSGRSCPGTNAAAAPNSVSVNSESQGQSHNGAVTLKTSHFCAKREVWNFPEYKWGMFIYSWMGIKSPHCGWNQGPSGTTETCFLYLNA